MNRPVFVLADLDANYLIPLEDKLTEELCGQIDLEIITDKAYFDEFFSSPQKIDNLIISDALFSNEISRHNISNVFILSENSENQEALGNVTKIFKYSSTKEIYNQIIFKSKDIFDVKSVHKNTQLILISSALGGSGKTTLGIALSAALAKNHKRTLFISTDDIQSFAYYLQNKSPIANDIYKVASAQGRKLYSGIMPYVRNEGFSYLPPFSRNIASLGMTFDLYNNIVSAVKDSNEYDYIVVDTPIGFSSENAKMFESADKVVMVVLQDAYSTYQTEQLLQNMDCRNTEKFMFVCNKFRRDIPNDYINSAVGQQLVVAEYIEEVQSYKISSIESYLALSGVNNLAYFFS